MEVVAIKKDGQSPHLNAHCERRSYIPKKTIRVAPVSKYDNSESKVSNEKYQKILKVQI